MTSDSYRIWKLLVVMAVALAAPRESTRFASAADEWTAEQTEFFEAKIRPVLVTHCYECHSALSSPAKGGLRLDSRAGALNGGDSGPAVVPGKVGESTLLRALRYEDFEMPPKGQLPAEVIADFERWIQLGAPDTRVDDSPVKPMAVDYAKAASFWAFQPPKRSTPPPVADRSWPQNDIDRYILHRLEQNHLSPAPRASRRTLIRRVYFDLVGLPPEPAVVERFVDDPSESAYDRLLDDLLASPRYGERWGRYWLDLARYAEDQAHTFKARTYPQGYLYRDWVVQALNDDLPYDQFLRMQIAADQLETAEPHRQRAALGLFALGPVYYQDNGEQAKALADEWDDRLDTLMRGTQALTVACARCHDHKYDPISVQDYYGLAGVFASSTYAEAPAVSEQIVAARQTADSAAQQQQSAIDLFLSQHAPRARLRLVDQIPAYVVVAGGELLRAGQTGPLQKEIIERLAKENQLHAELLSRWAAWLSEAGNSGAGDADRPYLSAWRQFRQTHRGGELASNQEPPNGGSDVGQPPSPAAGGGKHDHTGDPVAAELRKIGEQLRADVQACVGQRELLRQRFGLEIQTRLWSELFDDRGALGLPAAEIEPLLEESEVAQLASLKQELKQRQLAATAIQVPMAHTLVDGSGRDLPIYLAGDPTKPGPVAPRGFPAVFTHGQPRPFQSPGSGRRELAEAVASPENPLTARVMVNRVWAGHFGVGLVRTLENFGQLGDRPSHPQLLDALAVEFMESGWSLKQLHKQIMLSATYQQSSIGDEAGRRFDPENRLLCRMNRRRLEVEPWRDAVLSVSGQLEECVGGPSSPLDGQHRRRTLYGYVSRHRLNDLLRLFDFPDPNITAGERTVTTVPLQQLFVLNSDFMVAQARSLAARLQREAGSGEGRVQLAFELLFGRPPTADEQQAALEFLTPQPASQATDELSLWEQYCLAMLGANEFAFVD